MEEKAERARSADPRLARLGRGVSWCARALELSTAATPAPTRAPPRPRPLLKAVITLPRAGPRVASSGVLAAPSPRSKVTKARLRARRELATCARLPGTRGGSATPFGCTHARAHTQFYTRRSNTNTKALLGTQKRRRRRAQGTVYWLVQGFAGKTGKSSSAFSSKWPSQVRSLTPPFSASVGGWSACL